MDSPSKLNVPRRQRNQPSNQVGNLEFAVEINTSLIAQVRQLQAIIVERDEAIKAADLERSRLETEAEGYLQRLKSMDESEQRYKDENWNLETQTHEMIAAAKDAAGREQKLQQLLAVTASEKSAVERDLDDLKQNHGRLTEDFTALRKSHDTEIGGLRKSISHGETEKAALQQKVEELTSQNQELAKAVAGRFRDEEAESPKDMYPTDDDMPKDGSESEHSPPPSPIKGVQRHSILESETLKSSLHHAHRMIQNLKSNVHREKAEKLDLKRTLQEVRDELEIRKRESAAPNYESRKPKSKSQQELNRKVVRPNMLGAGRSSRTDILVDDAEWEEHNSQYSPSRATGLKSTMMNAEIGIGVMTDTSDAYQTANETEDAFETAAENEFMIEGDDVSSTVKRSLTESSDELTETEVGVDRAGTLRALGPSSLLTMKAGDRSSYQSTASASGDEQRDSRTSLHNQPQKYRLRINRGSRKSRMGSEHFGSSNPSSTRNSPAGFLGDGGQGGQSLFAELGNSDSVESGEEVNGTPSRRSMGSRRSTSSPGRNVGRRRSTLGIKRGVGSSTSTLNMGSFEPNAEKPPVPRVPAVDSGTMTEPWEPIQNMIPRPSSDSMVAGSTTKASSAFPPTYDSRNTALQVVQEPSHESSATKVTPPGKIWDQPLEIISNIIPGFGKNSPSTPISARPTSSREVSKLESPKDTAPHIVSPQMTPESGEQRVQSSPLHQAQEILNQKTIAKSPPPLSMSPIQSLETFPTQPPKNDDTPDVQKLPSPTASALKVSDTSMRYSKGVDTGRIISTIFGTNESPRIAEDETSGDFTSSTVLADEDGMRPFRELPPNTVQQHNPKRETSQEQQSPIEIDMADQSSQTVLSSLQIDNILQQKDKGIAVNGHRGASTSNMKPLSEIGAVSPVLPNHRLPETKDSGKGKAAEQTNRDSALSTKAPRRPLSTPSIRSRAGQYPPLPPDHQQAIAAAAQRTSSIEPAIGSMGPPLAPASAYRTGVTRPRTPSRTRTPSQQFSQSPASKSGTTPRARYSAARSQASRRSSVSSFASELDERFNIRVDGLPAPYGVEGGTDPRMIQAITQTMIGEFLWKYTRKAGRGDISSKRHRRFFWVHPYTRTLYWSNKDPAIAGRTELKAKSVGIEAVQVVLDDNPMPPGLHRKSLVIFTPGRSVKLTATTGQRHETWFNALSYLLLRTGHDRQNVATDGDNTGAEDIEEFNPTFNKRSSRTTGSRISLASFRNNPSQRSLAQRASSSLSTHHPPAPLVTAHSSMSSRKSHQPSRNQGSLSSRWSDYWRSANPNRNSLSSRNSRSMPPPVERAPAPEQQAAHDSAEDLRQVITQQEQEADHLENVRACCDGEFLSSFYPNRLRTTGGSLKLR